MFRTVDSSVSLWILYSSSTAKNYLFVICDYTSGVYIKSVWMKITCAAFCLICYAPFVLNLDDHFGDCFYVLYLFTAFIVCIVYWLRPSHPSLLLALLIFLQLDAHMSTSPAGFWHYWNIFSYVCIIIKIRIRIVINTFLKVTHKVIHYNGTEQWPTYLICVDVYVYWLLTMKLTKKCVAPVCPSFVRLLIYFYISFINSTVQSPDKPMPRHCVCLCVCKQLFVNVVFFIYYSYFIKP